MDNIPPSSQISITNPSPIHAHNYHDDQLRVPVAIALIFVLLYTVAAVVIILCTLIQYRRRQRLNNTDGDIEAANPLPHQQQKQLLPVGRAQYLPTQQQRKQQLPVVRAQPPPPPPHQQQQQQQQLLVDEGRVKEIFVGCTECVICLDEYANDEVGVTRCTLKTCGHRFHVACIDRWLWLGHGGCPICRSVRADSDVSVHGRILSSHP